MTAASPVSALADWSDWMPLAEASDVAPALPGVYLIRDGDVIVYAGMAGERRGKGLRGRLRVYLSGKGGVSGFGEAAFDRALGSPEWIEERLASLRDAGPMRAKQWAALAVRRLPFEVSWATCADRASALDLEKRVIAVLRHSGLWNR